MYVIKNVRKKNTEWNVLMKVYKQPMTYYSYHDQLYLNESINKLILKMFRFYCDRDYAK